MTAAAPPTSILGPGAPVLAFDVGGTDIKAAAIDPDGRVLGVRRVATPRVADRPAATVVARVGGLAADLRRELPGIEPVAAGISVPGIVDEERGVGVFSGNLGWRDAPVRDLAAAELGLPIAFGHDVRAAGLAEHTIGAARGTADAVFIALGTGISAVLFVDGRMLHAGGYAGEIGHAPAVGGDGAEPCGCGARGCLETVASASAIARRYTARTGVAVAGARDVRDRAARGDDIAARVWSEAVEALAAECVQLVAVVAPEVVVLGGGLAEAGRALLDPLAELVGARLTFQRRPRIVKAQLGDDAGLLGTAIAARGIAPAAAAASGGAR